VVTTSTSVRVGRSIRARLAEGEIHARVESVRTGENRQLTLLGNEPDGDAPND
jgi:hypothetical protein